MTLGVKAGAAWSVKVQLVPPPLCFSPLSFSLSSLSQAQVQLAPPPCSLPVFFHSEVQLAPPPWALSPLPSFSFFLFADADLEDEATRAALFPFSGASFGCWGGEATRSALLFFPGERFGWWGSEATCAAAFPFFRAGFGCWGGEAACAAALFFFGASFDCMGGETACAAGRATCAAACARVLRGMRFGIDNGCRALRGSQCLEWNAKTNWKGLGP